MNRIPLFVRTSMNHLTMGDIAQKTVQTLHLPSDAYQEINIRKIFSESMGNPIKKQEQREKLNALVKAAITNS